MTALLSTAVSGAPSGTNTLTDGTAVVREIDLKTLARLDEAIAFIEQNILHHRDEAAFVGIVKWAMSDLHVPASEIARAFEVTTPSVSRWRNGRNLPTPRTRSEVIAWITMFLRQLRDSTAKKLAVDEPFEASQLKPKVA